MTAYGSALVFVAVCLPALSLQTSYALEVPDFFLAGVQKSSTTFLSKLLSRNPALCYGRAKEPHYFDAIDSLGRGDDQAVTELHKRYVKNFKRCGKNMTFDATPLTWLMPHRLGEAYTVEQLARKKIVVILRHPVDREFSWYNHQLRSCLFQMRKVPFLREENRDKIYESLVQMKICNKVLNDKHSFEMYNGTEKDTDLISRRTFKSFREYAIPPHLLRGDSLYVSVLKKWLSIVRRDQLLILNFRTTVRNVMATVDAISDFLNVTWGTDFKIPGVISSLTKGSKLDCDTFRQLNHFFEVENADLLYIINNSSKPIMEPIFSALVPDYTCV